MIQIENLINKGIYIFNPPKEVEEKTVIILGIARSGTTLVARIINKMGVYTGDKISEVLEDIELSNLLENSKINEAKELIEKRNQQFKIWVWKRPEAFMYYEVWKNLFRNPHFIVVFRDPLSVSLRNYLSMNLNIIQGLILYKNKLENLLKFISESKEPLLLLSFEKIFKYPQESIESLKLFLGLKNQIDIGKISSIIELEPVSYLLETRNTRANGMVEKVTTKFCSGWAFYPTTPSIHAKVNIYVNGEKVGETLANVYREDIKNKKLHPTGICGFVYCFPERIILKKSDSFEAIVENDVVPLPIKEGLITLDKKPKIKYYPCEEIEFMNIDVFQVDLLKCKITISGIVLLKREIKGEYKLKAKAGEEKMEIKWGLSSHGLTSKYPDNPKAKESRFQITSLGLLVKNIEVTLNEKKIIEIELFKNGRGNYAKSRNN